MMLEQDPLKPIQQILIMTLKQLFSFHLLCSGSHLLFWILPHGIAEQIDCSLWESLTLNCSKEGTSKVAPSYQNLFRNVRRPNQMANWMLNIPNDPSAHFRYCNIYCSLLNIYRLNQQPPNHGIRIEASSVLSNSRRAATVRVCCVVVITLRTQGQRVNFIFKPGFFPFACNSIYYHLI